MFRLRNGTLQIQGEQNRWEDLPSGTTGGAITALGLACAGITYFTTSWPKWARIVALAVVLVPPTLICVAIGWNWLRGVLGTGDPDDTPQVDAGTGDGTKTGTKTGAKTSE